MTVVLYSRWLEVQGIKDKFTLGNPDIFDRMKWNSEDKCYELEHPTYRDVYIISMYADMIV